MGWVGLLSRVGWMVEFSCGGPDAGGLFGRTEEEEKSMATESVGAFLFEQVYLFLSRVVATFRF
jgi:hypothetical protein